ncbi:NAD(P)-dependent alcohol dehydrogenase [Arthrobacter sp. UYCu712]|uniref:NAD(P)-dependent alcohol dehydrogenase n=1 Tax=Arthrobacter sp. UYCu712 TaxID=3156340 RepID=UPI003399497B
MVEVTEVPMPAPARNEVLGKVHASTVSTADYRARSRDVTAGLGMLTSLAFGFFRPRQPILGMDVANVVESVGAGVTQCAPGHEVAAMLGSQFSGHAEYVCVREEAVTLVFGGATARCFLNRVSINPRDSVLVSGSSGAVGAAAVQLAKHLGVAVCSGGNAALVRSLGADRVIDYTRRSFTAEGVEYDVIVDCAGTAGFERVERSLKPGWALLPVTSDLKVIALASIRSRRSGKLITTSVGTITATENLAFVVGVAESGQYRPVIGGTYDLADAAEAHRYVAAGRKRGNMVRIAANRPAELAAR